MDTEPSERARDLLLWICKAAYAAEEKAAQDRKSADGAITIELLIMRQDRMRVEIRKENVAHNKPHIHVTHSDKIDASLSLDTFDILAGTIDRRTHKYLKALLSTRRVELQQVWDELNEKDNSVGAETLISNLGL